MGPNSSPPSTTEVSKCDLEVGQILTDLANGGAVEGVEEVDVDMEQVQVQEIEIQVADEPVQFQDQALEEVDVDILNMCYPSRETHSFPPIQPISVEINCCKIWPGSGKISPNIA